MFVSAVAGATGVQAADQKTIKIGWTAWSDAEAVTNIAKQLLEQRLGYKVELVMTDIGLQYQGVAKKQLDVMLMAWLPNTHKAYWDKLNGELVDLGILYDNAKLGWAVPDYVPASELSSISDLNKPEVAKKLKSQVQGIDPGAGLMRASEQALKDYSLTGYDLRTGSDAAMIVALDRAMARKDWIVVTTWNPHWMFSKYKVRYLEDPKKSLGGAEAIHAIGRKGFDQDFPKAAAFIKNFKIPLSDLEGIMAKAKESSYEKEATAYIASHPEMVAAWLKDAQ
ncbi:glycine/betaine ABC transporter substrate-binding protein [Aromatoleum petrolei]|uniref:Glycine/betaine ABC transporter substrate-binding protein n=2 Tax=Aromatoleum petrolei TaxID=76116 RepID=A0ABX1MJE3_9RHOO|nr:glycine betaine ABC transporter substrate-binding protein [Aromatoleum petrolei]NMF87306.1 glycine/betaine ABC transporter substrate-binding protein [Aromatoleum petrolei]